MNITREQILSALAGVRDPEVPVLSVIDLGIVREVIIDGDSVEVKITPTYSGCPALQVIEDNIVHTLRDKGFPKSRVTTVYSPAWTTDWMSEEAKNKLREYGIAPPQEAAPQDLVSIRKPSKPIICPFCRSTHTTMQSAFGATSCKAQYFCDACHQPFEYFKAF
ncbi:MAG: phenylacetate-CoA oxygenase subunit PaaJ [Deltaproteobacteria bacterium]|nr:phenylacetate-CoA oxygenase subunit PaaJ [Deltaproteobacteria bacterium]